jgi:hypothetical protein
VGIPGVLVAGEGGRNPGHLAKGGGRGRSVVATREREHAGRRQKAGVKTVRGSGG